MGRLLLIIIGIVVVTISARMICTPVAPMNLHRANRLDEQQEQLPFARIDTGIALNGDIAKAKAEENYDSAGDRGKNNNVQ